MLDNPYLRHHKRFLAAAALGIVAFVLAGGLPAESRLLVAGDTLFLAYLAMMAVLTAKTTETSLRQRAASEDEGVVFIVALTLLAIVFSLVSILMLLNKGGALDRFDLVLAIVSVPLGWAVLHVMAAQHYANLYYGPVAAEGSEATEDAATEAGGLDFPGKTPPGIWDFLYFSFVVGMTAQVSDVVITSARFRRIVLAHSVASFFFNTVLVAIAVNAAVGGSN